MIYGTQAAPHVFEQSSALAASVGWVGDAATGSIATAVGVVAVAFVGLLMLSGRLPARRGAIVVLGCFILFSARAIADGLTGGGSMASSPVSTVSAGPAYTPASPRPVPYDPYAGASVPASNPTPPVIR